MNSKICKRLARIYNDPRHPAGFSTLNALWKATNKEIPKKIVLQWLQSQDVYSLHRPVRKKFKRNFYSVFHKDELWQADLNDMRSLSKFNDGYAYILCVIDVWSKFAWSVPLKRKTGEEVTRAFSKIFKQSRRKAVYLQSDNGREFLNIGFQNFLKKNKVHFYHTNNPDTKACIVERFNRTLKEYMWRYFTLKNTYRYVDVLSDFMHAYNHRVHRSIGMMPAGVNDLNALEVWRHLMLSRGSRTQSKSKLKAGDLVRISRDKIIFDKGYEQNWSDEIFRVIDVVDWRQVVVYKIEDLAGEEISGRFYLNELQKVMKRDDDSVFRIYKTIRKKGSGASQKILVQWQGLPAKFNSWVLASDIQEI